MASEETEGPTGVTHRWLLPALSAATFVTTFNATASLATVVPVLQDVFRADASTIGWVLSIYQLVSAALVLSFGRVGDMRGHRPVFLVGYLLILLGATLAGLAPNLPVLLLGRGIQGVGGAMCFASITAILSLSYPASERGKAIGIQLTVATTGMALGPLVAGWLTHEFGWRAVFLANVPVGIVSWWLAARAIPIYRVPASVRSFDNWGTATFLVATLSLMLALNQGGPWGWMSWPTLTSAAIGILALATFVRIERRVANPILDLGLLESRVFSTATVAAFANYVGLSSLLFLVPMFLINVRGLSPTEVGLLIASVALIRSVVGPVSGALSDRHGPTMISTLGLLAQAAGLFMLAGISELVPLPYIVVALLVAGFGMGIFLAPNTSAILGAAPRPRQGTASGIVAMARNLGITAGVVVAGAAVTAVGGGDPTQSALVTGIQVGFAVAGAVVLAGAALFIVAGRVTAPSLG